MLSDHAPPTSTSKAAGGGGLTPQLLACLNALQPQPNFAALRSVSPRLLLDALRARAPAGALSAGLEHDAAEALELLCDLVAEDLQAAFACGAWQHLVKQASLAAVLDAAGGGPALASAAAACNGSSALLAGDGAMQQRGAEEGQPPGRAGSSLTGLSDGYNIDSTSSNTDDLVPPVPAPQPRPGSAAGRVAQTDRLLSAWQQHAWLPLRGANAHELSCVRCKHRSTVQLSPFMVLPLGIAVAPSAMLLGNVPAAVDASLEGSLAAFYGYEAVRGWHCTRCCLAASLDAAADDLPPQQQRLRQMLADGGQLVESETYSGLLAAAGEVLWLPALLVVAPRVAVPAVLLNACLPAGSVCFCFHLNRCPACLPACPANPVLLVLLLMQGCGGSISLAWPPSAQWLRGCPWCCACSSAAVFGAKRGTT